MLSTIQPDMEAFLAREQRHDVLMNNACVRHAVFDATVYVYPRATMGAAHRPCLEPKGTCISMATSL